MASCTDDTPNSYLRGALGDDGFECVVRLLGPAGHERRAVTRALLSSGDTHADKHDLLALEFLRAPLRVGEPFVAAVYDNVSFLRNIIPKEEMVDANTRLELYMLSIECDIAYRPCNRTNVSRRWRRDMPACTTENYLMPHAGVRRNYSRSGLMVAV